MSSDMPMNYLMGFVSLLVLSTSMIGCTPAQRPSNNLHEPLAATERGETPKTPTKDVQAAGQEARTLSDEQLIHLIHSIIDGDKMLDDKVSTSESFRSDLQLIISTLIERLTKSPDINEAKEAVQSFSNALLKACFTKEKRFGFGCPHIDALGVDSRSHHALMLIARWLKKRDPGSNEKWIRFIWFALYLNKYNITTDQELLSSYLEFSTEIANHIKTHGTERDRIVHSNLRNLVSKYLIDSKQWQSAEKVIDRVEPWRASRKSSEDLNGERLSLFPAWVRLALKNPEIYGKRLDRTLLTDTESISSRFSKVPSRVLHRFQITALPKNSLCLFLVDRYFNGHLGSEEIDSSFESMSADSSAGCRFVMIQYLRFRLIDDSKQSNRLFRGILKDVLANSNNSDLLRDIQNSSEPMKFFWSERIHAIDRLKELATKYLATGSYENSPDELDEMLKSATKSLRISALNPLIMAMIVHLNNWQRKTINHHEEVVTVDIIERLNKYLFQYNGSLLNFGLDVSSNQAGLSTTEILFSFEVAMRLESFSDLDLQATDFLKILASKLLQNELKFVLDSFEEYKSLEARDRFHFKAKEMCKDEMARQSGTGTTKPHTGLTRLSDFGNFIHVRPQDTLYFTLSGSQGNLLRRFKQARLYVAEKLRWVELFVKAYSDFANEEKIDVDFKTIEEPIKAGHQRMANFTDLLISGIRIGTTCFPLLNQLETRSRFLLLQAETEFLKQVHARMKWLKENEHSAQEIENLNQIAKIGLEGTSLHNKIFFDGEKFDYHYEATLLRLARFFKHGFNPKSESLDGFSQADSDYHLPALFPQMEIENDLQSLPPDKRDQVATIRYNSDLDKFLMSAFHMHGTSDAMKRFLGWVAPNTSAGSVVDAVSIQEKPIDTWLEVYMNHDQQTHSRLKIPAQRILDQLVRTYEYSQLLAKENDPLDVRKTLMLAGRPSLSPLSQKTMVELAAVKSDDDNSSSALSLLFFDRGKMRHPFDYVFETLLSGGVDARTSRNQDHYDPNLYAPTAILNKNGSMVEVTSYRDFVLNYYSQRGSVGPLILSPRVAAVQATDKVFQELIDFEFGKLNDIYCIAENQSMVGQRFSDHGVDLKTVEIHTSIANTTNGLSINSDYLLKTKDLLTRFLNESSLHLAQIEDRSRLLPTITEIGDCGKSK